jgi:hypothetical protein
MKKGLLKVAFFGLLLGGMFTMTSCHESPSVAGNDAPEIREVLNTISGTIVGSDGNFLANQTVKVTDANGQVYTARTDANGFFTIDGLKSGSYTLTVTDNANYVDFSKTVELGNTNNTADVQVLSIVMAKKTEVIENISLETGTAGTGEETTSETVLDNTDTDVNADDSKIDVNISVGAGTIASAGGVNITDETIVVTPFYDESAATTRATSVTSALYYGLYIHFASGRSIQNVTLSKPITITFDVDGSLVNSMYVKMLNFNTGTFELLTNGVNKDAAAGKITITTTKLGYFGLYFDVTEVSTASEEKLSISNPSIVGPVANPTINYTYKVGARLTNGAGSAYAKAFLKNWIIRQHGRSTVTTLAGKYGINVTLPSENWSIYATGKQAFTKYVYTSLGATYNADVYGAAIISYQITERATHSGGMTND